jgi:dTDP-4-amino-4,6-dideoxygalactose transaminase
MIPRRKFRFYKGQWKDFFILLIKGKITRGNFKKQFEQKIAGYIGSDFAVSLSSGRASFSLLLDCLPLSAGDEIIFPVDTLTDFIYLAKERKLAYKLIDIKPDSFNINPDLIEAEISQRTKVIVVAHRFGIPADLDKILFLAKKYNLWVIEDCAQSLGAEYRGKKVGSFGDFGLFVFSADKAINTFGGSIITLTDKAIFSRLVNKIKNYPYAPFRLVFNISIRCFESAISRSFLYIYIKKIFSHKTVAKIFNNLRPNRFLFTNLQALFGLKQLAGLDRRERKRALSAGRLAKSLPSSFKLQKGIFKSKRVFNFFIVKAIDDKLKSERIKRNMLKYNIELGIKDQFIDNNLDLGEKNGFPVFKSVFEKAIQLPIYDNICQTEITRIINGLKEE